MPGLRLPLVEKKGGSVGLPVNSCTPINITATSFLTDEGSVWLRTGVVSDTPLLYPLATTFINNWSDQVLEYDLSPLVNGGDITWDGTNWWHLDDTNQDFVQYNASFVLTGVTKGYSAQRSSTWSAFCNDGTHLYAAEKNYNGRVYTYNISTLTHVDDNLLSSSLLSSVHAICWDGTYFYAVGNHSDDGNASSWVVQYTADWVATGVRWSDAHANSGTQCRGISYNPKDGNLYMATSGTKVNIWTTTGVYVGTHDMTGTVSGNIYGLEIKDELIHAGSSSNDIISTAVSVDYVGNAVAKADENGVPIFTRIK